MHVYLWRHVHVSADDHRGQRSLHPREGAGVAGCDELLDLGAASQAVIGMTSTCS